MLMSATRFSLRGMRAPISKLQRGKNHDHASGGFTTRITSLLNFKTYTSCKLTNADVLVKTIGIFLKLKYLKSLNALKTYAVAIPTIC